MITLIEDAPPLPDFATSGEAAVFLRTTTATLRCWRHRGTGPDYVKSGAKVLYPKSALVAWLKPGGQS